MINLKRMPRPPSRDSKARKLSATPRISAAALRSRAQPPTTSAATHGRRDIMMHPVSTLSMSSTSLRRHSCPCPASPCGGILLTRRTRVFVYIQLLVSCVRVYAVLAG